MSNEESRKIPDTRGRPRNLVMVDLVDKIEGAYMKNRLPVEQESSEPKKDAKKLRLSASFQEMQEELGIKFRVLPHEDKIIICLGKG